MKTTPQSRDDAITECFERTQLIEENYPIRFVEHLTPAQEERFMTRGLVR